LGRAEHLIQFHLFLHQLILIQLPLNQLFVPPNPFLIPGESDPYPLTDLTARGKRLLFQPGY